jgi:hypothetical protein
MTAIMILTLCLKNFLTFVKINNFFYFRVENVKKCKHVNTSGFEGRLFRLFFPLFFFGDCFSLLDLVSIKLFDGKICIVVV